MSKMCFFLNFPLTFCYNELFLGFVWCMMKVLVFYIEEDETLRVSLQNFLQKRYDVISVDCESEALRLYRQMRDETDVVIIEFIMEHGIRLIREIEEINPDQKIITLSGSTICSCQKGCDYCETNRNRKRIMKPIEVQELIQAINDFDSVECQLHGKCDPVDPNQTPFFF